MHVLIHGLRCIPRGENGREVKSYLTVVKHTVCRFFFCPLPRLFPLAAMIVQLRFTAVTEKKNVDMS